MAVVAVVTVVAVVVASVAIVTVVAVVVAVVALAMVSLAMVAGAGAVRGADPPRRARLRSADPNRRTNQRTNPDPALSPYGGARGSAGTRSPPGLSGDVPPCP